MWAGAESARGENVGEESAQVQVHGAYGAWEASVRILAFTLSGRSLEAIEQGGL